MMFRARFRFPQSRVFGAKGCRAFLGAGVLTAVLTSVTVAQEADPIPKVVRAWKGNLRSTVELDGKLVPEGATSISLWLEIYRDELRILEVLPPGAFLNEGDVMLRFSTQRIDEQIREEEFELDQAQRKLARSEEERRIEEESAADEIDKAVKAAEWARRDLDGYLEKEKHFKTEEVRLQNQSGQHGLEDQQDELEQLAKMYEEDELVDATEEIVLKRARRRLASSVARFALRENQNTYQLAHKEGMKEERLQLEVAQKSAALGRQRRSAEIQRASRAAQLERDRFAIDKKLRTLERLKRDREKLTVRAPRSGLLLHGDNDSPPGKSVLERGGSGSLFQTILTVADPNRLKVVTQVPETRLFDAKGGKAAEVKVAAVPEFRSVGSLEVESLPGSVGEKSDNLYRAELALQKGDARLRPGMNCRVSIVVDEARDAVLIPKGAVIETEEGTVVRCASGGSSEFQERKIVLGPSDEKNVVVKQGLSAGDRVKLSEEGG